MKKILITGSNGFIGKSLVELLEKNPNYKIIAKDHKSLDLMNLDKVKDFFDENKIDYVIHCATVGGRRMDPDVSRIFYENTKMFENLILFRDYYKIMITFGSGAELESEFPLNYYGLSKKYITEKIRKQKLNSVVLRLWGCFGKYETSDRFIKTNIQRYKRHQSLNVHQDRLMDFFYIDDLVPIVDYYLQIENGSSLLRRELDVVYDQPKKLTEIAEIINNLEEHKSKIEIENPEVLTYRGRYSLFLDNFKFIGLYEGIKKMYKEL